MSVESIWQGLKDYELYGIDTSVFRNNTMKDLKRTTRKYGKLLGHKKGVYGTEHLDYLTARKQIYVPSYFWMLENKAKFLVDKIRQESENCVVILLDYDTNTDIDDPSTPLSHAGLIKAYIENAYPEYAGLNFSDKTVESAPVVDFVKGDKVFHPAFGEGVVKEIQENLGRVVVDFGAKGTKTLLIQMANLTIV